MSAVSNSLQAKWPNIKPKNAANMAPLSHSDCVYIDQYLNDDGIQTAYSALVSVGDAIRGIQTGFYSWSTVKLYYSVFYALRALLAFNSVAIFYVGRSPFWVHLHPGAKPCPGNSSSSHKVVMDVFRSQLKNSFLLSQPIGYDHPFIWLQDQRERVNYKQAKFSEPDVPAIFSRIAQSKSIRTLITAYIEEDTYAFDPDHAILVYPITALKQFKRKPCSSNLFDEVDQFALQRLFFDALGPMTQFDTIIKA